MITIKTPQEIKLMREGGRILARILRRIAKETKAGVSASRLNTLAEELVAANKATPSFKDYKGFPSALCVSVNSEVVHGLPGRKVISEGDVVGLDLGIKYKNLYTDAALTLVIGKAPKKVRDFVSLARQALFKGIAQVKPGKHLGDISWAIQNFVESRGYSVVRELVGHGVGYKVHEEPRIPNFGQRVEGPVLQPGMTFCIEPMINMGDYRVKLKKDGHTFQTVDRSLSAHFEHTVAVTRQGHLILTR